MSYVDGFVIAVPTANKRVFTEQAHEFDTALEQFGAVRILECWGDDVPVGKLTDFRRAVQATAKRPWSSAGSSGRTRSRTTRALRAWSSS